MIFGAEDLGYVRVRAKGADATALPLRAADAGIDVTDMVSVDGDVTFTVAYTALPTLRRMGAAAGCHLQVVAYGGPSFWPISLWRRRGSWLTLVVVVVLLVAVSGFAWRERIVAGGDDPLDDDTVAAIRAAAEIEEIAVPLWKRGLDPRAAAAKIMARCPDLAWAEVSCDGVFLTITAVERVPAAETAAVGDVIAAKDGVIKELFVLRGQEKAAVGDTVKKGDILISGHVVHEEEGEDPVVYDTAAKGVVTAAVWYEGTAYVSLERVVPHPSGRVAGSIVARKDGREFTLFEGGDKDINEFTTSKRRWTLGGWEIVSVAKEEATAERRKRSEKTALAAAERQAGAAATAALPPKAKIVGRDRKVLDDVDGAVGVTVVLETEERIDIAP